MADATLAQGCVRLENRSEDAARYIAPITTGAVVMRVECRGPGEIKFLLRQLFAKRLALLRPKNIEFIEDLGHRAPTNIFNEFRFFVFGCGTRFRFELSQCSDGGEILLNRQDLTTTDSPEARIRILCEIWREFSKISPPSEHCESSNRNRVPQPKTKKRNSLNMLVGARCPSVSMNSMFFGRSSARRFAKS